MALSMQTRVPRTSRAATTSRRSSVKVQAVHKSNAAAAAIAAGIIAASPVVAQELPSLNQPLAPRAELAALLDSNPVEDVQRGASNAIESVKGAIDEVTSGNPASKVQRDVRSTANKVQRDVRGTASKVQSDVDSVKPSGGGFGVFQRTPLKDVARDVERSVKSAAGDVKGAGRDIQRSFNSATRDVQGTLKGSGGDLQRNVSGAASDATRAVDRASKSASSGSGLGGIFSRTPLKGAARDVERSVQGAGRDLQRNVKNTSRDVQSAADRTVDSGANRFGSTGGNLQRDTKNVFDDATRGIQNAVDTGINKAQNVGDSLKNAVSFLPDDAANSAKQFADNAGQKAKEGVQNVRSNVDENKGVIGNLIDKFTNTTPLVQPGENEARSTTSDERANVKKPIDIKSPTRLLEEVAVPNPGPGKGAILDAADSEP